MSPSEIILEAFGVTDEVTACFMLVERYAPRAASSVAAVDVFQIARSLGIKIKHVDDQAFEGKYTFNADSGDEITLTTTRRHVRERFTISHEIGHWMLRQIGATDNGDRYRSEGVKIPYLAEEERLANFIAAEILLPGKPFRSAIGDSTITCSLIRKLSRQFKASRAAVLRRIADLLRTSLVHAVAIPNRFRDLSSTAIIDSATYVLPTEAMNRGLVYERGQARFASRISFDVLTKSSNLRLAIIGTPGRVYHDFSVGYSATPIPNAELVATNVIFRPITSSNGSAEVLQ
jgi:Zn-dependent peptidase ImmA (M78 family)